MKRTTLTLAFISLLFAANVEAQDDQPILFGNNSKLVKVGAGLNSLGIPVEFSYEKGVKQNLFGVDKLNLGLGGYLGYYGYSTKFYTWDNNEWGYNYSYIILGARGIFHYPIIKNIDTYACVMLGYNVASANYYGAGSDPGVGSIGGLVWGSVVGARFQFNRHWGMYAEAGYSIAYGSVGLVYKL